MKSEQTDLVDRLTAMVRRIDWRGSEADLRNLLAESAHEIDRLRDVIRQADHEHCGCINLGSEVRR